MSRPERFAEVEIQSVRRQFRDRWNIDGGREMSKVQITPLIDAASTGKGSVSRELWNASTETWDEYPATEGVDVGSLVRITATVTGDPDADFLSGGSLKGLGTSTQRRHGKLPPQRG